MPLSEGEVSLDDEEFTMPEEPLEQERFKRQLIATARSMKKKQHQLQADQDLLTDRWTEVLAAGDAQPKVTRSANCYLNSMTRHWSPYYQHIMRLTDHRVAELKRQLSPNTSPHYLVVKTETQQLGDTHVTCGKTWIVEQVRPDRSKDRRGVPRRASMAI